MVAQAPELSVVIPCFNEEEVLPLLRDRLVQTLEGITNAWEVVLVDDGSRDRTLLLLRELHQKDPRFKVVGLSRNFGHQSAVSAGLSYASGAVVAIMDADLQDPPEVLGRALERIRGGVDVIYAVREKRKEGLLKRIAYKAFYRLLKGVADIDIPLDSGDFCVMRRNVVDVLRQMPERNMFVRGMRAWAGFRQEGLTYERSGRAAGESKYPFRKLVRLALDGILSFSSFPLRLATWFGLLVVLLAFVGVVLVTLWRLFGWEFMGHTAGDIPGWAAGVAVTLFLGGVQLLILGIVGEYLARIYEELKRRPRWVVSTALGVPRPAGSAE